MTEKATPFMLVNAFTQDAFAGNPGAVLFLDKHLPSELHQKIAQNFSQPIIAFIVPSQTVSEDDSTTEVASFDISWFSGTGAPIALCGHGTLAAAKAVFAYAGLVESSRIRSINFKAESRVVITALRLEESGEWFQIQLPAARLSPLSPDEEKRVSGIVRRAAGRDDLNVCCVRAGSVQKAIIDRVR
jgi:predicted PhzF superfamily epimerase YddE/YHI9